MRTPAQIARMLGWPEAQVAAAPRAPKVIVWRVRRGQWHWMIGYRISRLIIESAGPVGTAPSQPEALVVGLAALEAATVHSGTHNRGMTARQIRTEQR